MRTLVILVLAGLLLAQVVAPRPGRAQQAAPVLELRPGTIVASGGADPVGELEADFPASDAASGDTLANGEWMYPPANLPRALGSVAAVNVLAIGINVLWRDEPTTRPGSWWENLQGGWEWDTNPIRVNSFEHPWAGAAYYNLARANGLSFYAALPVTAAGSLMWELFGEPRPPSTNDLLTTTIGGAALGEPLRRMSIALLDNGSSGFERFLREATVFVFNPGLGLDRLSRGQSWRTGPNPPDRLPETLRGDFGVGAVRLRPADGLPGTDAEAAQLRFGIEYGDPFAAGKVTPFSSFVATLEMSSISAVLTQLGARGIVAAIGGDEGPSDRVLGVFLDFDYRWDGRVGFGEQSIGLGLLSRFGSPDWRVTTDLSLELVPLLASTDRHAKAETGRYYEFGSGVGGRAAAQLHHRGDRLLSGSLRAYWAVTLDGASTGKLIQLADIEARTPRLGPVALGANLRLYRQSSDYDDRLTGHESLSSISLFVTSGS